MKMAFHPDYFRSDEVNKLIAHAAINTADPFTYLAGELYLSRKEAKVLYYQWTFTDRKKSYYKNNTHKTMKGIQIFQILYRSK